MITIYYHPQDPRISSWKERLDKMFMKYQLIEQEEATIIPLLLDGERQLEGVDAIEDYLNDLEEFVRAWYEDRCDRHDYDPDAPINSKS